MIFGRASFGRSDTRNVSNHADPEWSEQLFSQRANGDTRGGLAGRGSFEHVPDICQVVLEHAREVGMTGAWARDRSGFCAVLGIGRHPLLPVFEVAILDDEGDGAANRLAETDTGDGAHLVL